MRRDGRQDGVEEAGMGMMAQTTIQYSYVSSALRLWQMFSGAMCGTTCTQATTHGVKIKPCFRVVHYSKFVFLNVIRMCTISLVVQNQSVRLCLMRSGGRILDLTAKVAVGSCTLASLTDCHASVESLQLLMHSRWPL